MSRNIGEDELEVDLSSKIGDGLVADAVVEPESLKKQKQINKMQLTKHYTHLARLISDEKTDQEAILQCLESFEAKKFETLQIIDDLISTYRRTGDERNAIKTEEELDNVSTDADRDVASVKAFLSTTFSKPATLESLGTIKRRQEPRIRTDEEDSRTNDSQKDQAQVSRKEQICVNTVWKNTRQEPKDLLERIIPKFNDFTSQSSRRRKEQVFTPIDWRLPVNDKSTYSELHGGIDRKMQPIHIPKFKGDKTKFEYFWAAFTTIVDDSDELLKSKMIRLKSCLKGKAEEAIAKLGFSEEAYEEAKATLKRKSGGDRRQIQNCLDELRNMKPLQEQEIENIEKFTEHLVNTVVVLKEQSRWSELKPNSMLYTLLEKFPD